MSGWILSLAVSLGLTLAFELPFAALRGLGQHRTIHGTHLACIIFRHIARKFSAIHKVFPQIFRQSDENSDCAICAPELCGVALRKRDLGLCALVNLLTNPLVVVCTLLWRAYVPHPDWALVAALEAATVVTEGLIYRDLGEGIRRPMLFSLCANALSYGLGLLVNFLW